jgi:Zn-dependent protease with chaperone function
MAIAINRPAAKAASRAGGAALGLGLLGLACAALVLARLIESWRVSPHASSHHVTILGQRLGYPAANAGAIVVLALALPALVATLLAIGHAVGEGVKAAKLRGTLVRARTATFDDAIVIADERPLAFCAGLLRPRIYVSTQALTLLDERALDAVLEHERHHARRRDPLRLAAARVLARSLLFVPALKRLEQQQAALAELGADEAAVAAAPGSRSALARAVLAFADAPGGAGVETERIDQLIGGAPSWTFPTLVCLVGAGVLALFAAVAVLAGRVASGSATLAPPFLSRQPCVLTLAALSAAIALLAASAIRARLDGGQAA